MIVIAVNILINNQSPAITENKRRSLIIGLEFIIHDGLHIFSLHEIIRES